MKGLMIKDFLCLRKGMKTFIFVSLGVLIMAVMFVLSSQYGNLAEAKAELAQDATMSEIDMLIGNQMMEMAVYFMLIIPVAFVASVIECFKEDTRAGFMKPLYSMPLTMWEVAGSRYLICVMIAVVSMGVSLFSALLISEISGIYTFKKLVAVILTAGAFFLIYMSLTLLLVYAFGARRADFILTIPLMVLWIAVMAKFMASSEKLNDAQMKEMLEQVKAKGAELMDGGYLVLFLVAALCMGISYAGSVTLLKHRKGAA